MSYLLDTNVCISIMGGGSHPVRNAFRAARLEGHPIFVPSVVRYELQYGVFRSRLVAFNQSRVNDFLGEISESLPFDEADADAAARVRWMLEKVKKPIGHYDTLIAGQALARGLMLVTGNVKEFSRVAGLKWVDWATD